MFVNRLRSAPLLRRAALSSRVNNNSRRLFSNEAKKSSVAESATGSADTAPTTINFKQGAKAATTTSIWAGIAVVVGACGLYIGKELMPTANSPNTIFNLAFEMLREHPEVVSRLGDKIKGYGGDYSSKKEGRRNFVSHDTYKDIDGVKRTRVKFNMEGTRGKAVIYTEVAENMPKGEFAYIIIEQDHRGQREAVALIDNRPSYTPGELQEKVATRLNQANAVLYGVSNCPWTQRQLLEFGEFAEKINVMMCDKEENKAKCEKANLQCYPSWEIAGIPVPRFRPLEELQDLLLQIP